MVEAEVTVRVGGSLTHSGHHTGGVVGCKGQAGGGVHGSGCGQHVARVREGRE